MNRCRESQALSLILAALEFGLVGCQKASTDLTTLTDVDKQQITAHREALVKAVREGNASAIAAQFTEDVMYLENNGPMLRGRAAVEKLFQRGGGQVLDYSATPVEVSGSNGLAYEVGTYTIKWSEPGSTEQHVLNGKHIWILKKQPDGTWKDAADISNSDEPPPTCPQPAPATPGSKKR